MLQFSGAMELMPEDVEELVDKVTNLQHLPIPDPKAFEEDSWAFQDVAARFFEAEEEMKCQWKMLQWQQKWN